MNRLALIFALFCFLLAGLSSYYLARAGVEEYERREIAELENNMRLEGQDWVTLRGDGLRIRMSGLATTDEQHFAAIKAINKHTSAERVIDEIAILNTNAIEPPKFSLEMLRNDDQVSLIGLIPKETGRDSVIDFVKQLERRTTVTDMLEVADFQTPEGWIDALNFGLEALRDLPQSKVSVFENRVVVSAITSSEASKKRIEDNLERDRPEGIELLSAISAPRPVISPFTFRLSIDDGDLSLGACSTDTNINRDRIIAALEEFGLTNGKVCQVGLGVPTPDWSKAVIMTSEALLKLGGGTVTFTDSDISLVASDRTSLRVYDRVIGALENDLPDLFSLAAVLPPKPLDQNSEVVITQPEFTATRNPAGRVILGGRSAEDTKPVIDSFARSIFGARNVAVQTRIDEGLPSDWAVRVLGGLEAFGQIHEGELTIQPDWIAINGTVATREAESEITRILTVKVGTKEEYRVNVEYDPTILAANAAITPEACLTNINKILIRQKIAFEPGTVDIDEGSVAIIAEIAEQIRECPDVKFEIQGHTDSSGSEELNINLSQSRAESVLAELLSNRILTKNITAKGYGPANPVASNQSDEGREINRRIEFKLASAPDAPSPYAATPSLSAPAEPEQEQETSSDEQ